MIDLLQGSSKQMRIRFSHNLVGFMEIYSGHLPDKNTEVKVSC